MNKVQQISPSAVGTGGGAVEGVGIDAEEAEDQFPVGLRVLVVDDDATCLAVLRQMLLKCRYEVTTCSHATKALSLLRESKGDFHVVLSDVHMPDMDGFRLLELVGLEMDLPVIMMSVDARTNVVMKGIKHGACDYLIKPVRMEELKNLWQHVVRKKWKENEHELSGSLDDSERTKRAADDAEYASSAKDGADGSWRAQKKKRNVKEDDESELECSDPGSSKKPRVVWSVELHQQFVNAVNQLGIEQAVPKRILELMNVPGLTRENVASHLQKFRLYLKRLSGVNPHGLPNPFCAPGSNVKPRSLGGLDFRALAASGQITPQTLAALQDELLDQPSSSYVLQALNQPSMHAPVQGAKGLATKREITFGHPVPSIQADLPTQFSQASRSSSDLTSIPSWSSDIALAPTSGNNGIPGGSSMLPQVVQQQHITPSLLGSRSSLNVQPSCVVLPSQSISFQVVGNPILKNQSPYILQQPSLKAPQAANIPDSIIQDDILVSPVPSTKLQPANTFSSQNNSFKASISQPLTSVKVERDPLLLNDSAGLASVQSSSQIGENSPLGNDASYNSSCGIICSSQPMPQPNSLRYGIGELIDERLSNASASNSFAIPGMFTPAVSSGIDVSTSWRAQSMGGNGGHHNAAPQLQDQVSYAEDMPKQAYRKDTGFVGRGASFPSRFAVDDVESPVNHFFSGNNVSLGDDGDGTNQDNYRFSGLL